MIKLANIIVLMLVSSFAQAQQTSIEPIFAFRPRSDSTELVKRYAAQIVETPECDRYRDNVMSLANENPYSGKTTTLLIQVMQKARAAGCHK